MLNSADKSKQKSHSVLPAFLAMMLMVTLTVWCLPQTAFAAEHGPEYGSKPGHVPSGVQVYHVPASEAVGNGADINADDVCLMEEEQLPETYDSSEQSWYKGDGTNGIKVKDQGEFNLCWAFAASSAAEISYAKEIGHPGAELSPGHLGYFFFNRVDDPLHNTAGDKNVSNDWKNAGGSNCFTMLHMSTWSGLCSEWKAPYSDVPAGYGDDLAYDDEITEENSLYLDGAEATVDEDTLKSIVYHYGAAVVAIFAGNNDIKFDDYTQNSPACYYNPDDEFFNNHEVVLVGWDDTFSKDNFKSKIHDGSDDVVSPSRDGAWIIQNSWGTEEGDGGFYYVSYDSVGIVNDDICAFDMQPVDSYDYNFQYDGNADVSSLLNMKKGDQGANIFKNTTGKQISLDAITFTEFNDGHTEYDVDVYSCLSSTKNPRSGFLVAELEAVSTETPGFKTVRLPKPVGIDAGDTYSIVITANNLTTHMGLECDNPPEKKASNKPGQSFITENGKWYDLSTEEDCCLRIKGLANPLTCSHPKGKCVKAVKPTKSSTGYEYLQCTSCGLITKGNTKPMLNPVPNPTSISKITKKKKALTVTWKASNEIIRGTHISGYQIRYSQKSSMKKAKTVTVKGYASTSKKLTKLKSKKKYYVQIRTCYKDAKGKTWTSAWSKSKSAKTK